jgi:hypothetical protein
MKLAHVKQLWWVSRHRLDAAAQDLAIADARHEAAQQALVSHRKAMMSELARSSQPGMWSGLACWYPVAESRLDDLEAVAGRLAGEAEIAREMLGAAMKEAERFRTVTAELVAERRAEASKREQDQLDESALRRTFGRADRS